MQILLFVCNCLNFKRLNNGAYFIRTQGSYRWAAYILVGVRYLQKTFSHSQLAIRVQDAYADV